jgi:hypothetical protein
MFPISNDTHNSFLGDLSKHLLIYSISTPPRNNSPSLLFLWVTMKWRMRGITIGIHAHARAMYVNITVTGRGGSFQSSGAVDNVR